MSLLFLDDLIGKVECLGDGKSQSVSLLGARTLEHVAIEATERILNMCDIAMIVRHAVKCGSSH